MGMTFGSATVMARLVFVLVMMVVSGCGSLGDDDGEGAEVEALSLELGDCFNDPGSSSVESVMVVACSEPHDFEVYYIFELPEGEFPGVDVVEEQWIAGCLPEFEGFVGLPFDESVLDMSAIFPTEQTWSSLDDREVLCSVTAVDGAPRTGSAKGSRV